MRRSLVKRELFVTQGFAWGDTCSGRRQNQAPGGRKGSSNNDQVDLFLFDDSARFARAAKSAGALAAQPSLCHVCKRGAV